MFARYAGNCVRAVNVTQYKCEPGDVLVDENMVATLQPFYFDVEAIELEEPPHAAHQTVAAPQPPTPSPSRLLATAQVAEDASPKQNQNENASALQKSQPQGQSLKREGMGAGATRGVAKATKNRAFGGPAPATETRGATFYRIRSLGAALRAIETDFEPRLLSRYAHRKSQPLCNPLEYRRFFATIKKCA